MKHSFIDKVNMSQDYWQLNPSYSGYKFLPTRELAGARKSILIDFAMRNDAVVLTTNNSEGISGAVVLNYQGFDSEMLHLTAYQIYDVIVFDNTRVNQVLPELMPLVDDFVRSKCVDYLTASLDTNNPLVTTLMNTFLASEFYYVGTLLKFGVQKDVLWEPTLCNGNNVIVRKAELSDIDRIADIARCSYKNDRFHLDPNLDPKLCDKLFMQSTINSFAQKIADFLIVCEVNGEVAGYLSARKKTDHYLSKVVGEGMISAVDPSFRGRNLFSMMSTKMWMWFQEHCDFGESGTYINNLAVHRAWTNQKIALVRGHHQLARFVVR